MWLLTAEREGGTWFEEHIYHENNKYRSTIHFFHSPTERYCTEQRIGSLVTLFIIRSSGYQKEMAMRSVNNVAEVLT